MNSTAVSSWNFDAMNVLSWAEEAGVGSAWLQFMALPGGPIFLGTLKTAESPEEEGALLLHVLMSHDTRAQRRSVPTLGTLLRTFKCIQLVAQLWEVLAAEGLQFICLVRPSFWYHFRGMAAHLPILESITALNTM